MKKTRVFTIVSFLLPLFLAIITEEMFPALAILQFKCFALTCIIYYAIFFLIFGLTKKSNIANIILTIFITLLSIISQIKIAFMDEPLFISDIFYLGDAGEIGGIIKTSFWSTIKPVLPLLIIQIILISFLIYIANKFKIELDKKKFQLSMIIPSFTILFLLFAPIRVVDSFILDFFFEVDERLDYAHVIDAIDYYREYGSITGMYGMLLENRNYKPKGYDEEKLDEILSSAKAEENKSLGTPNIVVLFSESFWDIDQLEEVEFDKPITPNFNKLKDEGLFFEMISPSYGGTSANIEFEFLTGATMNYFTPGYVPSMQLYTNSSYYNRPSIVNELQNADYRTKIVQSGGPKLFNCAKFYEYLNFDETAYTNNVEAEHTKGPWVSDEYITDLTIEELKNKKADEKLFYMILTLQSHMPYLGEKYDEYDISIKNSNLTKESNEVLLNYGQGIYDADRELARLYEYIKTYEEPTILIFYGDHLPFLNNGKENAMDELKFFNTDDKKLNLFRKYNTQALVLANFDLTELKDTKPAYLSPDLLSTYVLSNMDIELSDYYKWLYQTKDTIGASNRYISADQQGNIYYTNELKDDKKELYDLRKMMQYKFFIKR